MEFAFCACNHPVAKRMILKSIRWEKPNEGWLTLNTDGSATGSDGLAGGGGLIRDGNGTWLIRFARRIGTATSFLAELWLFGTAFTFVCKFKSKLSVLN